MFRFENPPFLYGLFIVLILWIFVVAGIRRKKKKFALLGDTPLILDLIPYYSTGKQHVKGFFMLLCLALLIVCIANPQMGTTVKKAERKGIDIMIALDISNSMNCEDIQPSRLMRSKQAVIRLLDKLENDRIGLVVFAGDAFLQLPLTSDYGAAKLFISNIETEDISTQGTAIGSAINLCLENFDPKTNKLQNKAIIVISDGENHEDDALGAAKAAAENGIMVNTIGMGLPQGAPIPEYRNGELVAYKKDKSGNVVITQLNEAMLNSIAQAGNGYYVGANNTNAGIETIFNKINKLEKSTFEQKNISDYETRYQYPLFLVLIFLILEIFIFEKQHRIFNRRNIFSKGIMKGSLSSIVLFICCFGFSYNANAQVGTLTHTGNKDYERKNYIQAEEAYRKALKIDSLSARAAYNLGNSQYRQKQYDKAAEQYAKALEMPGLKDKDKALAAHNLGNSYFQTQKYDKSVEAYKEALRINPSDQDTKYNLAYALKKLQQQQQQQQQQNKDKNKENKDDKNKENKDNQNKNDKDQQENKENQNQDQNQNQDSSDKQNKENKDNNQKQNGKMQQSDMERMLQALENQEKNTLDKLKKKEPVRVRKTEKDW